MEISLKQTGQNITIVVDGVVTTRKIADKEAREAIKATVAAYNENPLKKHEKTILSFVKEKGAKEEAKKVVIKESKTTRSKKAVAEAKEKPVRQKKQKEAKEVIEKEKAKPAPAVSRRSGEW